MGFFRSHDILSQPRSEKRPDCPSRKGLENDDSEGRPALTAPLSNDTLSSYYERMGSSTANTVIRSRQSPDPLRVVNWPLRDDGVWSWLLVTLCAAIAVLCGRVSGNLGLGLLSFVALALSVWRLWVPVTFALSSRGIVQIVFGRQRRISWPQIARYEIHAHGILLLADAQNTPLAPLRGLYIRWNGRRAELLELVSFFLDTGHPALASTQTAEWVGPRQRAETPAVPLKPDVP